MVEPDQLHPADRPAGGRLVRMIALNALIAALLLPIAAVGYLLVAGKPGLGGAAALAWFMVLGITLRWVHRSGWLGLGVSLPLVVIFTLVFGIAIAAGLR
jgi:hypothetical protein